MQTKQEMFLDLMGQRDVQFIIPVYQRSYAWTEKQCDELWRDINRAGRVGAVHFIGTVLYKSEQKDQNSRGRQLALIDGQQRIATLTLLLASFRSFLRTHEGSVEGIDAEYLDKQYLHAIEGEEGACKLILSRLDRDTMVSVINESPMPENTAARVVENLDFFTQKMADEAFDPKAFWAGLQLLLLIDAELGDGDHAQYVFDSMNSKGMPLTTADLVRNRFLIAENHEEQTRLYREYWLPIESMFDDDKEATKLNNAIKGWLAVNLPGVHARSRDEVYSVFKHFIDEVYEGTTEEMLQDLRAFAKMYAENFKFNEVKRFRSEGSDTWHNEIRDEIKSKMPYRFSQGGF